MEGLNRFIHFFLINLLAYKVLRVIVDPVETSSVQKHTIRNWRISSMFTFATPQPRAEKQAPFAREAQMPHCANRGEGKGEDI